MKGYGSQSTMITSSLAFLLLFLYCISNISNDPHKQPSPSDWSPHPDELTSWINSAPMRHCPHGSDRREELLKDMQEVAALQKNSSCRDCPQDITFVFVTNLPEGESPLVEKLYKLCGCRFVHIRLSKEIWPGWQWIYKVDPVLQWLETNGSSLPVNSYIIFSDAFDTGLVADPKNIVDNFLSYNCDLLGMSTVADWPPNPELKEFEEQKYPWSKCRPHLSAGAWMARVTDAVTYLRLWKADWIERGRQSNWDDQMAFRRLHRQHYPRQGLQ